MGLVRGHLHVGIELYKNQYFDNAKRHMKHPKSELYSAMIPTFEAKNTDGFASELEDLALTVESDKDLNLVLSKYEILLNAITENEKIVDIESNTFDKKVELVETLLEIAAEEYAIGIVNGNVKNKFEYQDALGFTIVAKNILNETKSLNSSESIKRDKIIEIINSLMPLWPSLVPIEKN
ncbi:MAG: hypothetical protein ACJZ18_04920 [Methylophilaceae bacterium]